MNMVISQNRVPEIYFSDSKNSGNSDNPKTQHCNSKTLMITEAHCSLKSEWLDSETAANYLSISVQTLRNLTSNGQIPFYKLGRRNRYRKDELDFLLLQSKRGKLWE